MAHTWSVLFGSRNKRASRTYQLLVRWYNAYVLNECMVVIMPWTCLTYLTGTFSGEYASQSCDDTEIP